MSACYVPGIVVNAKCVTEQDGQTCFYKAWSVVGDIETETGKYFTVTKTAGGMSVRVHGSNQGGASLLWTWGL